MLTPYAEQLLSRHESKFQHLEGNWQYKGVGFERVEVISDNGLRRVLVRDKLGNIKSWDRDQFLTMFVPC